MYRITFFLTTAFLSLSIILTLTAERCLFAQVGATTGDVVGLVKDSQGGVIKGAVIEGQQLATNSVRTVETDKTAMPQLLTSEPLNGAINAGQKQTYKISLATRQF